MIEKVCPLYVVYGKAIKTFHIVSWDEDAGTVKAYIQPRPDPLETTTLKLSQLSTVQDLDAFDGLGNADEKELPKVIKALKKTFEVEDE